LISEVQIAFFPHAVAQNRNTISGYVFDSQRNPVANVFVELLNDVYSTLARTKTNGAGRFFFANLSAGRYYLRVLPYGTNFEEQTQEIEIVNLIAPGRIVSENLQKDIYLRLRRGENRTVTGAIFVQDVPQDAQKSYKKAIDKLNDKKTAEGIAELENALKLFPDYFLALERLGGELIKLQKFVEAERIYQKAVVINPRGFNCWYGLSYSFYGLRQAEKAIEAAEKAVAINPQGVEAQLMLGISQRLAGQFEKAEKSLKQADKLAKGKSADVYWNLALLYAHNLKRYKEAADALENYLKTNPKPENAEAVKKLIKQFREKVEGK
jgi:tetratricopeptide (TPR) repeat protein